MSSNSAATKSGNANSGSSGNSGKGVLNSSVQTMQKVASNATSSMHILVGLSFLLLVVVLIYIIYRVRKYSLRGQDLMRENVINANPMAGEFYRANSSVLPELVQGNEFSISFWMYIDNINDKPDKNHKIVMYQGNPTTYENGTFYVFLDGNTNKLYVRVRTNAALEDKLSTIKATTGLPEILANPYFVGVTLEYIAIARWVHIAFTVKDATLSLFMDGELYTVSTVYDLPLREGDARPVIPKPIGDIMLGGKSGNIGVQGYLGTAQFFNYALTLREVKRKYGEGPYATSFLRYFGLPNVAFRSPLYYTNETNNTRSASFDTDS
jgi:hypothetical protein